MTAHPSAIAAAFLSTGIISLAPNVLLFLFPNYAASAPSENVSGRALMSLGQALAVGGLLGDVFLHTLPDCFAESIEIHKDHGRHHDHLEHQHDHDHNHHGDDHAHNHHHHHGGGDIGFRVLMGFAAFLILDILVRSLEESHGGGHSHGHSHPTSNHGNEKSMLCTCNGHGKHAMKKDKEANESPWRLMFSSAVLLNLLGDALHNFTDGLAIGATFAASQITHSHPTMATAFALLKSRGGLASISVFLHEIPHELGDFATLVNAGLSRNMAIGAQFLTAIAAFLGTALGLFSGNIVEGLGHDILLPFTAGGKFLYFILTANHLVEIQCNLAHDFMLFSPAGFVYLACVTMLPNILQSHASTKLRLLQIVFFALGVAFMYLVAELEEMEEDHGEIQHHKTHEHSHEHHEHSHAEL